MADHREDAEDIGGGGLVISITDSNYGGGVIKGDWVLHPKEVEHCHAIYCDMTDSGHLREVCAESGDLGLSEVVVT